MELKDTDPMPFGESHRGKPMQDVPVAYLHWFYCNVSIENCNTRKVMKYIENNMNALKLKNKDLIWKK